MTAPRTAQGASRVAKRKTPLGWVPWVALLLLGLLALGALLIARNVGDTGDDPGVDLTDDPATSGQSDEPGIDAETDEDTEQEGAGASTTGSDGGTAEDNGGGESDQGSGGNDRARAGEITGGDENLLPPPSDGLAGLAGDDAVGTSVAVESVVSEEGFWVGTSSTERIFVRLESPEQVDVGQLVSFRGTVEALQDDPADLGVDADEGAALLQEQAGYLLVDTLDID